MTVAVTDTTTSKPTHCEICKQPIDYNWSEYGWCSEYCSQVPDDKKRAFMSAQPGDLVDYPCAECGAWIADLYVPGGYCGDMSCQATRYRRDVTEANALLLLCRQHVPQELKHLIDDWRKNK